MRQRGPYTIRPGANAATGPRKYWRGGGDRAAHDQAGGTRGTRGAQRNGWRARANGAIHNQARGSEHGDSAALRNVGEQAATEPGGCDGPSCQEGGGATGRIRNR